MISAESKVHTSDRVLKLELMDNKKPKNVLGTTDPSLFTEGGNELRAVMDLDSCLWSFKYKHGAIPPALRGTFTGFGALKKYADQYFFHRNIKVIEVKEPRDAVAGP